ncbi:MAG: aminotransferase class III-fold pyridoxal phosphate-dependent enzyme [Candidatus Omnitrophica bacterium]|nr:aminotransferase class III-fold pyridoxal phosphate-dependent enzyme [Candidatus Omnitrophota bacterium]
MAKTTAEPLTIQEICRNLMEEPPVPVLERRLDRSMELKRRAEKLIPSCSQTFSKGPSQFVQGIAPVYLERGSGCTVWDVDGNSYLDYCMALGAVLLGYGDSRVSQAVSVQMKQGTVFTLSHPLEVELSETLRRLIPCAEMVRFGKNGSDVTSAAVRLARGFTGREMIACCGYHGWQDWYIGATTRNRGVPEPVARLTKTFKYNDLGSLEELFRQYPGKIAAVIMEPVGLVEPKPGFLEGVQKLARKNEALLVFDEMVTGFRFGTGGAQQYFGVTPDMACFGKGMANGMAVSAIVGRRDVMELFDEIFFSFTFAGETASLAAALATLQALEEPGVLEGIWARGRQIQEGYNLLAESYGLKGETECVGLPPRTGISFHPDETALAMKTFVQQECIKRGYLFTGAHNLCAAHNEQAVESVLRIYRTVLELLAARIRDGALLCSLEGPVIQPVFRKM